MASIKFVPSADASVVSDHSRSVISAVPDAAGLASCVITSTMRTPLKQAKAMLVNIEKTGIQAQLKLYGKFGRQVIRVYETLEPSGIGRDALVAAMAAEIDKIGPEKVSRHCGDQKKLNVVDIAPSSISAPKKFLAELEKARVAGHVSKVLSPANGDPAFHVEIPQPA